MLLHNKSKEFKLSYDGKVYIIPEGKFHCNSILGTFIKEKNNQWEDINIEVLDNSQELVDLKDIVPVKEKIKEEAPVVEEEPIKEEIKENTEENISEEVSK